MLSRAMASRYIRVEIHRDLIQFTELGSLFRVYHFSSYFTVGQLDLCLGQHTPAGAEPFIRVPDNDKG